MKPSAGKNLKRALYFSLGYIVFCSLYIWLSGRIARLSTANVELLAHIELVKGIAFILSTGILLFIYMLVQLNKITTQKTTINLQRETIGQKETVIQKQSETINEHRKIVSDYERRALAGIYAASIAHDINNLLTICFHSISELKERLPSSSGSLKFLNYLDSSMQRMETSAKTLREIGKKEINYDVSVFELGKLVRDTVELTRNHKRVSTCDIHIEPFQKILVKSNAAVLEQCLINLIINAADAVKQEGVIEVRLTAKDGFAFVEVHDDGPGVPLHKWRTVFEAYVTDKEHGSGLGLAGVKMSMDLLHGDVLLDNSSLGGAQFTLKIPLAM